MRGKRFILDGAGSTWRFEAPGPDFAEYTPPGTPHVMNQAHYASNGWFVRMNARAMQKFDLVDIVASVGRGTDEIATTRLAEATASKAEVAFLWAGINDIMNVIPRPAAEILANLKTTALALKASGKRVFLFCEMPLYGANNTAARALVISQLNQGIRKFVRDTPGLDLVDIYRALVDPTATATGAARQYMLATDNLHPCAYGADEIAKVGIAATAGIPLVDTRVTSVLETYGASALNTNVLDSAPFAAGAVDVPYAGSQVGAGYAGFKENNSGAVFSVVDRADGMGKINRVTYTPTANGDGARWLSANINGARVKNNMRVYSETTVKTTGAAGGVVKMPRHYLMITLAGGAGSAAVSAMSEVETNSLYQPREDVELFLRTPAVTLATAPTNLYALTGLASWSAGAAVTFDMSLCKIDVKAA
ncbi:hypothetical protein GJV26_00100 [Massilia dura]|uniref:SGNH hydrolase-type esterase domain-containing protein n=1 Tax=Pseudoduganella dura TaxID=321982 RepID=A0A6I3XDN3_9BURK|nr:hypothetical protein [Pseudoduganella dura]